MSKSMKVGTASPDGHTGIALGLLSAATGAVGFGFLPLVLHWAYEGGLSPETALLWRYGGGLLLMAPSLLLGARAWRHAGMGFWAGVAVGLGTIFLFHAYASLPVSLVILIFYTYPAFTLIFSRLVFGVALTPRLITAAGMILLAAMLIMRPDDEAGVTVRALALAFLAPMGFAGYLTFSARINSAAHVAARINAANLGALIVALPTAFGLFHTMIPAGTEGWLGAIYLAVITGVASTGLVMMGAALAGSVRAAVAGGAELVTALLVGVLLFAEPLSWNYILCAALLAGALGLSLSGRRTA